MKAEILDIVRSTFVAERLSSLIVSMFFFLLYIIAMILLSIRIEQSKVLKNRLEWSKIKTEMIMKAIRAQKKNNGK